MKWVIHDICIIRCILKCIKEFTLFYINLFNTINISRTYMIDSKVIHSNIQMKIITNCSMSVDRILFVYFSLHWETDLLHQVSDKLGFSVVSIDINKINNRYLSFSLFCRWIFDYTHFITFRSKYCIIARKKML